jgi:hypothetical protein
MEVIYLFIESRLLSVSHDGYVDKNRNKNKNKNKHIIKLQITNQKQIDRNQIPPPSAVGFTHSGDEAPRMEVKEAFV